MDLQVLQENLSKALSITSRFASSKAQLPVLGNIYLLAKKNKLIVASTNLELSVSLPIGAKVKKEGEITIPSRVITDLIGNLPAGSINLSVEKENLKVTAQNFRSTVSAMNASDFPSVPHAIGKNTINLDKEGFLSSLSLVLFSASTDETRPVLTGVLTVFKKGEINLVATDGFRLSLKKLKTKGLKSKEEIILPKNALSELTRLSGEDEDIKFSYKKGESQVVFAMDGITFSSRTIEGEFPDFQKIIPKSTNYKINLDREELLRAVKLSSIFAKDSANMLKLKVLKDTIEISAESSNSGEQKMRVDAKVESENSKTLEIAFNYRFLEEFLSAIKGEEVQIELTDPNAPGVFTDPTDSDFLHLIMPVRLQS